MRRCYTCIPVIILYLIPAVRILYLYSLLCVYTIPVFPAMCVCYTCILVMRAYYSCISVSCYTIYIMHTPPHRVIVRYRGPSSGILATTTFAPRVAWAARSGYGTLSLSDARMSSNCLRQRSRWRSCEMEVRWPSRRGLLCICGAGVNTRGIFSCKKTKHANYRQVSFVKSGCGRVLLLAKRAHGHTLVGNR